MLDKNNEVFFGEYCKTCKYKNYSETDSPCAECIAEPVNLYSHKPVKWEGANGIFSGPPPRPDHAYQRAVKYIPEKRKDKEKAIARLNIDAEYTGNKVQSISEGVTDDQYPSATAVKKALEGQEKATTQTLQTFGEQTAQSLSRKIDAPSGCKCGEFLAVEEVDEEGVVKKVRAEEEIDPKLIRDMYYSEIKTLLTWIHDASNYSYVSDVDIQLIAGNRYIVSINGEEYVAIAETQRISRYDYGVCIGKYISSDLPFWITVPCTGSHDSVGHGKLTAREINADTGTEIKLYEETLHTIKEKYFPKTIFSQGNAPVKFGEGELSTIQGTDTTASGSASHAEGSETTASGKSSHAEGNGVTASGAYSHAEGVYTKSSGDYSHAEGYNTTASGKGSHAEGDHTTASGHWSHAEGSETTASGKGSHAEGLDTVASNAYQSVSGMYNVYDNSKYRYYEKKKTVYVTDSTKYVYNNFTFNNETGQFTVHEPIECDYDAIPSGKYILWNGILCRILSIVEKTSSNVAYNAIQYILAYATDIIGDYVRIVGNGNSDDKRSNAHTLDWQGNAWFAGDVYVGSTSGTNKDNGSVRLATVEDLLFCFRFLIEPAQNEDGTINYISDVSALFILRHVLRNVIADAGNSIECLLPLSGDDVAVLNFTETYMNILADGNMAIGFKFSSYVSGKHISAEIKDTISGFNTDDEKILSTVVTVTENASLPTPATAQVGQIVKVKAVDADGKVTETESVDIPNRLDVTVSMGDNGWVVSHKFAEIKAAYDAGRAVQLIATDTSIRYSLIGFFPGSIEGVTYADFRFIDDAGDIWKTTITSNDEIEFFQGSTFLTLYGDIPQDTPKAITYSATNGIGYADVMLREDTALILKSSTEGSAKKFKITVDDSGTISATEITETPV